MRPNLKKTEDLGKFTEEVLKNVKWEQLWEK